MDTPPQPPQPPPLAPGVPELEPSIRRERGGYQLQSRQRLPRPRGEVFAFFSDAANLQELTPRRLRFEVLTPAPIRMERGALIDYRLRVRGLPLRWRSLISDWQPPERFEDTQLRGPYRQWVHLHRFVDEGETTLVEDVVRYRVPGGRLAHAILVRSNLLAIFRYRWRILAQRFPAPAGSGFEVRTGRAAGSLGAPG
ncbi:MAG: SRPBCC family protein [Planctomycetes bacterium]|nr:SRPBCC family protein [Planctomycetota bacterium]